MSQVLIHYSEIGLKGKNRLFFENTLMRNITEALDCDTKRLYGRILVTSQLEENKIRNTLRNIPGIANFAFCFVTENDINKIESLALDIINQIKKRRKIKTFKVEARRSVDFLSSTEINKIVGKTIKTKSKLKVDLEKPNVTIYIEITEKGTFIYTKKIKGLAGLPIGTAGKVIALISGGIDSPVASYLVMKRGCKIVVVHFFNETFVKKPKKIYELIKVLKKFQPKIKLYSVPFSDIQKTIISSTSSKYRMIIYRRFMNRIATIIAKRENAKAIVCGDSLGQVASQTIENMNVIDKSTELLILRPLLSYNKEEIIKLAKKIGTYNISIKPYQDCCSFLIAKHPETKANLSTIENQERKIDIKEIINTTLRKVIVNRL